MKILPQGHGKAGPGGAAPGGALANMQVIRQKQRRLLITEMSTLVSSCQGPHVVPLRVGQKWVIWPSLNQSMMEGVGLLWLVWAHRNLLLS